MGGEPYWYFTGYNPDINAALQNLRQQEFKAGHYNPAVPFLDFPLGQHSPSPGAKHASIQEALEEAQEEGTRSILDIESVGEEPNFGVAAPLSQDDLEFYFETAKPTREMIEENMDFLEEIERGHCIYIIVYRKNKPDELFFAGYSYD